VAQSRCHGHVLEAPPIHIAKERQIAVPVHEEIISSVIVHVAPDAAHRDAFAGTIQVGDARCRSDLLECAVASVAVQRVRLAEPAVREVQVAPSVAVEINDRDAGAQRNDVRLDVRETRIQLRRAMHEADAGARGLVTELKRGPRGVCHRPTEGIVGAVDRGDREEERNRDDCAFQGGRHASP
jgi:hypothetical protein